MASRAQAASGDYSAGVSAVTTPPGARAAANKQGYLNGVNDSADKWARKTAAVSLSEWQQATLAKAPRYASGVAAAKPKIEAFWQTFGPKLDSVTAQVRNMDASTYEARKARALAQMDGVHNAMKNG
jgi:hypothetical protein